MKNLRMRYLSIFCFSILSGCFLFHGASPLKINGTLNKKPILLYTENFKFFVGANIYTLHNAIYKFRVQQVFNFNVENKNNVILNMQELSTKLNNQEVEFTIGTSFQKTKEDSLYISANRYEHLYLYFKNHYQKGDTLKISFGQDYLKYKNEPVLLESVYLVFDEDFK